MWKTLMTFVKNPSAKGAKALNTAGNPRLVSALAYAKRGWAVLPARPGEKRSANKHGFKDATTDKAAIVRAWTSNPAANVGSRLVPCRGSW
jgi:hypothetical protein